jgi:putative oxidoreductase
MKTSAPLDPLSPHLLSVLRIMSALLFLEHGTSKLLGVPPSTMHWSFQIASPVGWSGIIEFVGGILLAVGLFTRFTAFILSGEMAVAYFMVHAPHDFYPMVNKGEIAVLYCFVFLYLAAAGGGPWSLDRLRHRG